MKYLKATIVFRFQHKVIRSKSYPLICEKIPTEEIAKISYDNIDSFIKKYGLIECPFDSIKTKKGTIIQVWTGNLLPIKKKSWKDNDTELELLVMYEKINPSLQNILDYPDIQKAIQYLKESGLEKDFFQKTIDK